MPAYWLVYQILRGWVTPFNKGVSSSHDYFPLHWLSAPSSASSQLPGLMLRTRVFIWMLIAFGLDSSYPSLGPNTENVQMSHRTLSTRSRKDRMYVLLGQHNLQNRSTELCSRTAFGEMYFFILKKTWHTIKAWWILLWIKANKRHWSCSALFARLHYLLRKWG